MFTALRLLFLAGAWLASAWAQAPVLKARQDFDKVDLSARPSLQDALVCAQSQTPALAATRSDQHFEIFYRRAYCELFAGIAGGESAQFQAAARDFTQAGAAWPPKSRDEIPAGLRVLVWVARLEQGRTAANYPDANRELEAAITGVSWERLCPPSPVMNQAFCKSLVETGRAWLGWLSYRVQNLEGAATVLAPIRQSPWALWVAGRQAQRLDRTPEAADNYAKALAAWAAAEKSPNPDLIAQLGPKPDLAAMYYELGLANFAVTRHDLAITAFDQAVSRAPSNSHAVFVRARAKEALGLDTPALADYKLAAENAKSSNDLTWPVGEAHYYRGVLLYRKKDYAGAGAEFSSAEGAKLLDIPQADVTAWRGLAEVAGGACQSGERLDSSLRVASVRFPKDEADALVMNCRLRAAAGLDQLLALDKALAGRLTAAQTAALRARIADAYADQGVAAEDRKDSYAAVIAYRNAIQWNPRNVRARFNLGAIYIEDRKFNLAEAEYQALVEADSTDHEAQFWLAESILAQRPPPDRRAQACGLLRRSLAIVDPEKRAQFSKSLAAAKCP